MIKTLNITLFPIQLQSPFWYATLTLAKLRYALVTISDHEGNVGYGEVAAAWDVTGETDAGAVSLEPFVTPLIVGKSLEGVDDVRRIMSSIDREIGYNGALKAGIVSALLDALGKRKRQNVLTLLGGSVRPIKAQKVISFGEFDDVAGGAQDLSNIEYIKVKCGKDWERELSVLQALRARYPVAHISVDANQGWTLDKARETALDLEDLGIVWIEQPLTAHTIDELRGLKKTSAIPLMLDESVLTLRDAKALRSYGCFDMLNIKLAKCGGILAALDIMTWCDTEGVPYMLGDMLHSSLGTAPNLYAALLGKAITYDLTLPSRISNDPTSGITEHDGIFETPTSPGLGISIE